MTKSEMLDKLNEAKRLISDMADYFQSLEDDGEFKLSIFAELYDAEVYTQTAIEKVENYYNKLLIK